MTQVLSITKARVALMKLSKQLEAKPETTIQVTHRGRPVLAVLSWELYDSLTETLDIFSDKQLMAALRQSAEDIAKGRTLTSAEVARRHGLKP